MSYISYFTFVLKVKRLLDIFPHADGKNNKPSLKALAKNYLDRGIQESASGHDPREDALAALDLIKLKIA